MESKFYQGTTPTLLFRIKPTTTVKYHSRRTQWINGEFKRRTKWKLG